MLRRDAANTNVIFFVLTRIEKDSHLIWGQHYSHYTEEAVVFVLKDMLKITIVKFNCMCQIIYFLTSRYNGLWIFMTDHKVTSFTSSSTAISIYDYDHLKSQLDFCQWCGVLYNVISYQVCQWFVEGCWFSRFPPSIKLNATIAWNIVESGVKHILP
jgi:hypothetical protein